MLVVVESLMYNTFICIQHKGLDMFPTSQQCRMLPVGWFNRVSVNMTLNGIGRWMIVCTTSRCCARCQKERSQCNSHFALSIESWTTQAADLQPLGLLQHYRHSLFNTFVIPSSTDSLPHLGILSIVFFSPLFLGVKK